MAKPLIPPEEILDRTLELLDDEGPEALNVRRLSTALKISPNTLYQQVGNRAELTRALVARHFSRLTLDFKEYDTWESTARQWCMALHKALRAHPYLTQLMTLEDREAIEDYVQSLLQSAVHSGIPRPLAVECCRGLTNLTISHSIAHAKSSGPESAAASTELKKIDKSFQRLVGWVIAAVRAEADAGAQAARSRRVGGGRAARTGG